MNEVEEITAVVRGALKAVDARPASKARALQPGEDVAVRKGESALTSRPFRLITMLGAMTGKVAPENAKVERELAHGFRKALEDTRQIAGEAEANSLLLPVKKGFLHDDAERTKAYRDLVAAVDGSEVDRDELAWLAKNGSAAVRKAAMSYLTETTGGSLVPPPEAGEVIPLMRNKSALDRAGARQVPLPPQGKWVAPRITGPSTGYWITESTAITESNPTTGAVEMMAKKNAVLIRIPNELFKFASAATDAMFREDVAKTLALNFDYAALYGTGSGGQPKGLIRYNTANELIDYAATTPTPGGVAANGNTLRPEDGYRMAGQVEDRNFDLDSFKWVMRPTQKAKILSYRSDAVAANDAAGLFVQGLTRLFGDKVGDQFCGYPVVGSSQVRNTTVKGASGAVLTEVFGGAWPEFLMGVYGAVEFAANAYGEATFIADQTLVRGILHCDCVPRYPGAFTWYQQLVR